MAAALLPGGHVPLSPEVPRAQDDLEEPILALAESPAAPPSVRKAPVWSPSLFWLMPLLERRVRSPSQLCISTLPFAPKVDHEAAPKEVREVEVVVRHAVEEV